MLSFFSYNIYRGKKIDQIYDWFHEHATDFDFCCFQEFPESSIEKFIEPIKDQYSYEFSSAFTFSPGIKRREEIYGQLTLFNKKNLKLVNSRIVNLGGSKIEKSLFRNSMERTALITRFKYKKCFFIVTNCHLTPFTHNNRRLRQLELVIKHIRKNDIAIITGDFNYPSIRQKGLIEFMENNSFENGALNFKTYKIFFIRQQYDYIFSKNCEIKEIKVERLKFSDHYPIIAQFDPSL